MKIITGARRTGKTTKLVMNAAKTRSQIVCMDHQSVAHTRSLIDILGLRGFLPVPITFHELLEGKLEGTDKKNISIDDSQAFLQRILGNIKIDAVAIEGEVKIDAISIEKEDNE
jgi:hypothetical protein